jgi:ABC-2 type transport system ATP-binding protein
MANRIEAVGLEKSFVKKRAIDELVRHPFRRAQRIQALRGVDLIVAEGEIFGLLGPNGAGKTTLLKILACLVLPDRGRAVVGGNDTIHEYDVKRKIGLVHSDERSFYWRLSGRENLRFFASLYDVPRRRTESRIDELLQRVEMAAAADRPFSDYSSGMKQRMAIARSLLHDPPILLMDEPTRSLDPAAALALRAFIRDELQAKDGKTILIASHNLLEIQSLADRLAILIGGRVRQQGTVEQVRRWGIRDRRFALELEPGPAELTGPFQILSDLADEDTRKVIVAMDAKARLDDLLRALHGQGQTIKVCDRLEPDLEQAFSRILESEGEQP